MTSVETKPPANEASSLSPFRHSTFTVLWLATVVSNIGSWMQNAAAGWLMVGLDPDPFIVSLVQVSTSLPMFLFATTFYPLSVYPAWARPIIEVLPLYQSIQLLREPALGIFHWDLLVAALYLIVFGSLALALATRRLNRKLLP